MTISDSKYDYIIAGSGCAGLSLAMMLKESTIKFEKILIVDKSHTKGNDRTWCFWSKRRSNWFDKIVFKKWTKFSFIAKGYSKTFSLAPYQYCMIRGIDFYDYCYAELKKDKRFFFIEEEIISIETLKNTVTLKTNINNYSAYYLFNSALRNHSKKAHHVNYIQHFKGYLIETPDVKFDADCPVFMDFSVQQYNDCRFVYVIPYSNKKALIEYTGFSPTNISDKEYDDELCAYIKINLKITDFKLIETEKGQIPMAESEFINPYGARVINIGTAGGYSKPSTGFTFYFIQKNIENLIRQMETHTRFTNTQRDSRFMFYDKVLLDVIDKKVVPASTIFTNLFQKNKISDLLEFLNEESNLFTEFKIMNSVPRIKFLNSAIRKSFKK